MIGRRHYHHHQPQRSLGLRAWLLVILAIVVVTGFVVLAFIDAPPPLRQREIPIPPERFSK